MGKVQAAYFFVAVLAVVGNICHAQTAMDAVQYIQRVESQVKEVSQNAVANFVRSCELLGSCRGNCSRQACLPLQGDEEYSCKRVSNNSYCYDEGGNLGCRNIRVSMANSFVRVPTNLSNLIFEANTTICSQRNLDATFKNISSVQNELNSTFWVYFASVEGVHRAFPGRDLSPDRCTFEPRKRPWYMGVTAVKKDVIVLLDAGNTMGDLLPGDLLDSADTTKLNASLSIVNELLDTLAYGDRVTVITFNNSGARAVLSPITVGANGTSSLKNALQGSVLPDASQGSSNLTSAFILANQTFAATNALKVILTITDGQIMPVDSGSTTNSTSVFDSIRFFNTLVQIYSFDRDPSAQSLLKSLACDCFGTYERILTTLNNPLWTLRSYFGILARVRLAASNNMPYWTKPYDDNGSLGKVITVVYPAFVDNYTLIGVAGVDVLLEDLGPVTLYDLTSVLLPRGNTDLLAGLSPPRLPCSFELSTANQCPTVTAPPNALCEASVTSGPSLQERLCSCSGVCLASVIERKSSLSRSQIGGIGVGAGLAVAFFTALLFLICKKKRLQSGRETPPPLGTPLFSDSKMEFKTGSTFSSSTRSPRSRGSLRANSLGWASQTTQTLMEYTQEDLAAATNNWNSTAELGRGAHGQVFKGVLSDGTPVAIKKPTRDVIQDTWDTFATELELLSKLNHKRLVRLLGYCKEEIILVYEFMENGTLADWLHPMNSESKLGWERRLKIALGAARGLEYLHEYAMPKTYHGDVKPANILLDHEWEAHVSDFGLSIWSKDDKNPYLIASRIGGTFGYLDPEFVSSGQVTFASDVYSFGIVLLELISGRSVVVEYENIREWATKYEEEDALEDVLDKSLETPEWSVDVLVDIVRIALRCTERKKQDRPKMKDVASSLDHAWHFWVRSQGSIREDCSLSTIEPE